MKIVVADSLPERALEILAAEPSWSTVDVSRQKARLTQEIRDARALLVRSATQVTPELLAAARQLLVIGRAGVGVDNIDLDAATRKGILVLNTPGGNAVSVAEHTLALLLALAHHITQADSSMKQGRWEKSKFTGVELRGKTLGLAGLGAIGSEVARLAQAHQMTVIAFDPYVRGAFAAEHGIRLVPFDELMRASDFVSLHCSLTPETTHLINAKTLALARRGVRIVNCARGELVDEGALAAALESGRVAAAALDVFEHEPPKDSPLVRHPNVISTPHIAGSTEEAQEAVGTRIAEQVRDFLLHGVVRNAVNLPAVSPEDLKKLEPYLQLGERLGSFLAQAAEQPIEEVRISYDGGLAGVNTHLVKNAVLKGLFSRVLAEPVNLVNAAYVAESRGLEVIELRSARRAAVANSLHISAHAAAETLAVLGMTGLKNMPYLLSVNDIEMEAPLKGVLLLMRNQDVPGVIGRVGTVLGEHGINIANFALGRSADSNEALGLVNVDQIVPEEVLLALRRIPAMRRAQVVEIP